MPYSDGFTGIYGGNLWVHGFNGSGHTYFTGDGESHFLDGSENDGSSTLWDGRNTDGASLVTLGQVLPYLPFTLALLFLELEPHTVSIDIGDCLAAYIVVPADKEHLVDWFEGMSEVDHSWCPFRQQLHLYVTDSVLKPLPGWMKP